VSDAAALVLRDVSVRLGGRIVVDRISLDIHAGEFAILVGPNGAGKTTLLRAMAGLVPVEGSVLIEARPAATFTGPERGRKIAYLAQAGEIHWPVPTRDVVALGRLPFGASAQRLGAADRAAIAEALAACDLGAIASRRVTELSGGEKARVLLARALAVEAPLLLLDEPVAAFDPAHQIAAMRTLADLAASGRSVIAVLHDLSLALRFATKLILMGHGRLADIGSPAEIVARRALDAVFGVAFATGEIEGTRVLVPRPPAG
jgi:iron complex transport system ATP-binding protein